MTGPIGEALEHGHSMPRQTVGRESAGECGGRVPARCAVVRPDVRRAGARALRAGAARAGAIVDRDVLREGHDRRPTDEPPRAARDADDDRRADRAALRRRSSQLARRDRPRADSRRVTLAGAHTVPAAVRLGAQRDDAATQSRLAAASSAITSCASPPSRRRCYCCCCPRDPLAPEGANGPRCHTGLGRDQISKVKP